MCGATRAASRSTASTSTKEAVIQGVVHARRPARSPAYVRLLDRTGEFTAEVPTSATGHFRFFAGDGDWTLRTLVPQRDAVDKKIVAKIGEVVEVEITV